MRFRLQQAPPSAAALPFSLVLLVLCSLGARAQDDPFMWGWTSHTGTSIPTCEPLGLIIIESDTSNSVPPYYLIAYPMEGTPRRYNLGATPETMRWRMDYEAGTRFLVQVVDSRGVSGGTPRDPYVSVASSSTTCVQSDSPDSDAAQAFTVSANVTGPSDQLETCDYWGIAVKGGEWPYTWSLIASQSPVVTNVTSVSEEQDTFTYVNRADPGRIFLAAVSDATGRYAYGRTAVNTTASSDVSCPGRAPSFGNSGDIGGGDDNGNGGNDGEDSSSSNMGLIVGAAVGGVAVLVLIALAVFFWRRKRGNQQRKDIDLMPSGAPGSEGLRGYTTEPYTSAPVTPYTESFSATSMGYNNQSRSGHADAFSVTSGGYNDQSSSSRRPLTMMTATSNQGHTHQMSQTPLMVGNRVSKREEAARASGRNSDAYSGPSSSSGRGDGREHNHRLTGAWNEEESPPEIVIQHRDSGPMNVREVPPAYADLVGSGPVAGPSSSFYTVHPSSSGAERPQFGADRKA